MSAQDLTGAGWIEAAETELMALLFKSYDHSDFYPSFGLCDYFLFGDFYAWIRLDPGVIDRLLSHPDDTVRSWARDYPELTPKQMADLIRNDAASHWSLAHRRSLPPECLRLLYEKGSELESLAAHPGTPVDILVSLADTLRPGIFSSHPCLPLEVLEKLFERCGDNTTELFALASQPQLPAHLALQLIRNCAIPGLLGEVAVSLRGPRAAFELLATHPQERVRTRLAANRRLPADIALQLAQDAAEQVRKEAEKRLRELRTEPQTPRPSEDSRLKYSQVNSWWAFDTDLRPHLFFRLLALLHDSFDHPEMMAQSALAPDWQERFAVARNLRASPELLQQLSQDPDPPVANMAKLRLSAF